MLGGGLIAGELWWPGKKLILIPGGNFDPETLKYTATERFSHGWVDARSVGLPTYSDKHSDVLYGNEEALVFSEDSLEQIVIDIRRDGGQKLSIKPRTITFDRDEAKRQARVLGSDQAHGERLDERIIRVFS